MQPGLEANALSPIDTTMGGVCRVLPQECGGITCRFVDVGLTQEFLRLIDLLNCSLPRSVAARASAAWRITMGADILSLFDVSRFSSNGSRRRGATKVFTSSQAASVASRSLSRKIWCSALMRKSRLSAGHRYPSAIPGTHGSHPTMKQTRLDAN